MNHFGIVRTYFVLSVLILPVATNVSANKT